MSNVTATSPYLRHFTPDEVMISNETADVILNFFWPGTASLSTLTAQDVEFAQALLLEAIDDSYAMGYVHIIYDVFYMRPYPTMDKVKEAALEFAKKAFKHWFAHASQKDLEAPKIYQVVRDRMALQYRSVWEIRRQTGELTY